MAASLNSVATCCYFTSECRVNSALKIRAFTSPIQIVGLRELPFSKTKRSLCLLVTKDDRVVTDTSITKEAGPLGNEKVVDSEASKNNVNEEKSGPTRLPLTARKKLKAARVLNRYNELKESKVPKPVGALGSKVMEALRESDKGKKKSGLPEAPTNMFDDGKRGMPKAGLTFELPVGMDVAVIIFSFVFITTVMFSTTYVVWKLGGIHFNEY
ncbi:uncharacterized protein LOC124931664 [Impatiens glandulifera]|uniref:uncharacterized protein LOC124931664 n=1 Tax=Impatiens glandulifera TaxID=253017 RepID=UPI001FB15EDE|nr:uncharacterized protein LOC124931664 [Impatiens glandulifera]